MANLNETYIQYLEQPTDANISLLFDGIKTYVTPLCYPSHIKDDLAEDAATNVWLSLPTFEAHSTFKTWVSTIARGYVAQQYKQRCKKEPYETAVFNEDEEPYSDSVDELIYAHDLPYLTKQQNELLRNLNNTHDFQISAAQMGISMKAIYRRVDRIKERIDEYKRNRY